MPSFRWFGHPKEYTRPTIFISGMNLQKEGYTNIVFKINKNGIDVQNGINSIHYSMKSFNLIRETNNYLWVEFVDRRNDFYIRKPDIIEEIDIETMEKLIKII